MNSMTWQFEDSAVDQLVTALAMAPVQVGIGLVWCAGKAVAFIAPVLWLMATWFAGALAENWKPLVKLFAIVTAVTVCAMVWQIGVGVMVIATLTWMQKRYGKI